jgi:hypothetical protein
MRSFLIFALALSTTTLLACAPTEQTEEETEPTASATNDITVSRGGDVFESGVRTDRLLWTANPEFYGRQRSDNWCWAASLQTIILFHGAPVNQEQIVARAFGRLIDRPASPVEIAKTVNGWRLGNRVVRAEYDQLPITGLRIRQELENDQPGILGLRNPDGNGGHAYVITSILYRVVPGANGQPMMVPLSVTLRDPWPTSKNFQTLAWEDVKARFVGLVYLRVD